MAKKNDRDNAKYKRDLDKLFRSGGEVPERFKDVMQGVAPEEGSEEAAYRERVDELRKMEGFRDFVQGVKQFLADDNRMPDDEDLLARMLDHPDNRVVRQALGHIVDLHRRRSIERAGPIINRLETIRTMTDDPGVLNLVAQVEQVLTEGTPEG